MSNKDLIALREKYGLSRKQLCDAIGIPYRTLQSWELGERSCPLYTYLMIKKLLEFSSRFGALEGLKDE